MVVRKKKALARRVPRIEKDDLQWRISNSLLIMVIGLLFFGYGAALAEEQHATGMITLPSGGLNAAPAGSEWAFYMHTLDRNAYTSANGPGTSTLRFSFDTGTAAKMSNPVVAENKVFFGSDKGVLYAADWRTGTVVWTFIFPSSQVNGLTVYMPVKSVTYSEGVLYAGTSKGLTAFNATTGAQKWAQYYSTGGDVYEPIVYGSMIVFSASDGQFYAVGKDGKEKWKESENSQDALPCAVNTPVTYYGSTFYMGTQKCGIIAYNTDGTYKGSYDTSVQVYTHYGIAAAPSASNDRIYFSASDGKVYAMGTDFKIKDFSSPSRATAIAITSDGKTLAYGLPTNNWIVAMQSGAAGTLFGSGAWSVQATKVESAPALDSTTIYYGSGDGKIYARKITDGSLKWSYDTNATQISAPALADNGLFVTADNGKLYAIGPDKSGPYAVNARQDRDAPNYGETVTVSADWTDNTGLASATLEVKEGTAAAKNVSTVGLTGTSAKSAFTITATQAAGTTVKWKIYAFDTDGNAGVTAEKAFITYEKAPPAIGTITFSGIIGTGGTNTITAALTDNAALKDAVLATDETGTWTNWTGKYGSAANLSGTSATATFHWSNAAYGAGKKINFRIYARDASGNVAISDIKSFDIVSDVEAPSPDAVGQASALIGAGGTNRLYAKWLDNNALAKAELMVGEGSISLTKVNEAVLTGKSAWSNFTYKPSGGDGTVVNWVIRGYDFAGNQKDTGMQSFMVVTDKTKPSISNAQSAGTAEVGRVVTLSADVSDNVALKTAKIVIDGVTVQTIDLNSEKTAKVSYAYSPNAIGPVSWQVIAEDTAGNTYASDLKTLQAVAQSLECAGTQPQPSQYGACINNTMNRVIYVCDKGTGTWAGSMETAECKSEFQELPVAYMAVGLVLVVLAISSLLLYKKKYLKSGGAKPEAPKPAAPQW
jgi:outer membrane protein assembly factor BamB